MSATFHLLVHPEPRDQLRDLRARSQVDPTRTSVTARRSSSPLSRSSTGAGLRWVPHTDLLTASSTV